jgi:cytochrome c oxidase subunit 1
MTDADAPSLPRPPLLRRLVGFNLLTAVLLGIGGYFLGRWLGDQVTGTSLAYVADTDQSDVALALGYLLGVVGFLVGLGFANYPIARMLGRPPSLPRPRTEGIGRYFGFTADHKVVAKQYFVGVGVFFAIGGLHAMLIRLELLRPEASIFPPDRYLEIVGLHGAMMMGTMTSAVLGPFGNFFVPLLIGARRSAFPRIEALSFWLLMAAGVTFASTVVFGGFQTGWTGYAPLSEQNVVGVLAYVFFFALVGLSMLLLGFNLAATVITMRAPGMSWGRLPIFVWGILTTAVMMVLAAPVLVVGLVLLLLDRAAQTSFYLTTAGGSSYLFENLFWFFGHPEVYLLMLPGAGILLQLLPVFTRKPLWGYRVAVAGMIGIALVSFTVWQHHLFMSGLGADLRTFYMFSTELISIPTGLIILAALGTLWRGRIRFEVPMLFCLAWIFNFLIGGITGIYQSDVPSNVTIHGSFFVLAHFHYTIMGALIFVFFAAIYYWVPKMFGLMLDQRLGRVHFWLMFLAFNSTFFPLFIVGFLGMPRRVVTYPERFELLNEWASISAFVLGFSMLVFLANLVYSVLIARTPAPANPWSSTSLEWQTTSPPPPHNFDEIPEIGHPHDYGVDEGQPIGGPRAAPAKGS